MSDTRIFNKRRRWLLRQHISRTEIAAGVVVALLLSGMLAWVAAQKNNFNAGERDLPYEVLVRNPVVDRLYRTPFKAWSPPPGSGPPGGPGGPGTSRSPVDLGLFPQSILGSGWAIGSRPRRFTPATLFEKINGEADKFIRQGFLELHFIRLKSARSDDEIAIELFDQGDFAGALGIFSDHKSADSPVETRGSLTFFRTSVGAIGFTGRYFFRIAGNAESQAIASKTGELLRAFAGLSVAEAGHPYPFRLLNAGLGIDPKGIAYQRNNVFQYDFAGDFWFGQPDPGRPGSVFVHEAPSPAAAAALFRDIAEEHGYDYQVVDRTESSLLMRHPHLNSDFAMEVKGRLIFGVDNEGDRKRTVSLMKRLAKSIGAMMPGQAQPGMDAGKASGMDSKAGEDTRGR